MLRRLEKRILVDLPVKSARSAMFAHHLPQTLSQHPLRITTQIDYDQAAEVNSHSSNSSILMPIVFALHTRANHTGVFATKTTHPHTHTL